MIKAALLAISLAVLHPFPSVAQERPLATSSTAETIAKNLVDRGNEKVAQQDFNGARDLYNQALKIKPDYARAYFDLGVVACHLGNPIAEITYLTQVIKYDPTDAISYAERGIARLKLQDKTADAMQAAIADFTQALKLNPRYGRAYWGLGRAQQLQGKDKEAVSSFTQSIQLDPGLINSYLARGTSYLMLGSYQLAAKDFSQALHLDSSFAKAYRFRSAAKQLMNDKRGALADLQEAAKLYAQQRQVDEYREAVGEIDFLEKEIASAE